MDREYLEEMFTPATMHLPPGCTEDTHCCHGQMCTQYSFLSYIANSNAPPPPNTSACKINSTRSLVQVGTILYYAVLYCTILYYAVLYCTVLYYTVLYYTVLYCTILYCTILYYTVLYCTILYYTILYYTVLYCTILYYTVLYYTVLYYTVLYCTILYYTVLVQVRSITANQSI
jgi:hypothetical protein